MQYQIPRAKRPIEGPIVDTSWQPPPQAQPPMAYYSVQQAFRYQNGVPPQNLLFAPGTDTQHVPPPQAQPEQSRYRELQRLRYQSPALWDQPGSHFEPLPLPPLPAQASYALLQAWRYQNAAKPEIHTGAITDVLWLPPPVAPTPTTNYGPSQAWRYSVLVRPIIHMDPTPADIKWQPNPLATPEWGHYLLQQALRYQNTVSLAPLLFDPTTDTWIPPSAALPELRRYAGLHALRYLNAQLIDQQGKEFYGPCLQLIAFSWTADPNPAVTDYHIELGSASGLADRYNIDVGSTNTVFQGNILGGTYFYRVRSYIGSTPGSASTETKLVVTCDTFLQPALPAQPEQAGYARLQSWRYQTKANPEVTQLASILVPDILGAPTFPDPRWFLRRVTPGAQIDLQGPLAQTIEPIPPQAQPSLAQYVQLVQQAWRFRQAAQIDIPGAVVQQTTPVPGLAPPPDVRWWNLGQSGRYRTFAILVPGGPSAPPTVVTVTTDASIDLPELLTDIMGLLGDAF